MTAFVQVAGEEAGPTALGILVPPGKRTLVIVRPRSLDWDLVAVRAEDRFLEMSRPEAVRLAEILAKCLREPGAARVEAVAAPKSTEYWVRAQTGNCQLVLCERVPGERYRSARFDNAEAAIPVVEQVAGVLAPTAERELYLNTNQFSR